ncbi:DNA polymerase III subunit delta [Puniceicoccus vermicola]|uniref:DNA polymerase III subunit delta n=1 Tax=Puniceicoccus vermicola TaxID=388746 RepID=A0A7X1AZW4_9BACT|nr:DNA polymerase III subunit delta [Puniceicoccus vermicola]MBC2603053.1 DNA polymerase III subunit delta [Puniceicoccus vermicola]
MSDSLRMVLGDDEFLVDRRAGEIFKPWKEEAVDEYSVEIVDGRAQTVDEAVTAVTRFAESAQTDSLFGGGAKTVWLRNLTFLGDGRLGQSAGAKQEVERLQELLKGMAGSESKILISGAPVDRRRSFYKWVSTQTGFEGIDAKKAGAAAFQQVVEDECKSAGVTLSRMALEVLRAKLNGEIRMAVEEIRKLITALPEGKKEITEKQVAEEVPEFGEPEFFEAADKFFRGNLGDALEALRRHFFNQKEGRPLLSNLMNRNRLMIQARVLSDSGMLKASGRRVDAASLKEAAAWAEPWYGDTSKKTPVNVFAQNPFYLGNLAEAARRIPLRRLFDFQTAFVDTFREMVNRPNDHEAVFRELAVRCLAPTPKRR